MLILDPNTNQWTRVQMTSGFQSAPTDAGVGFDAGPSVTRRFWFFGGKDHASWHAAADANGNPSL
jgi:hypothetical protein